MRYEIKDIMLPTKVKEAMQMQVGGIALQVLRACRIYRNQ
jgi:hypothetical protein